MERIFRILLFIAGGINFAPSLLAFLPSKIPSSYGLEMLNQNYELVLRHRAVMLGIVGGLMIYAAISKKYYTLAFVVGFISMISFVLFYLMLDGINPELEKVMKLDLLAIGLLLLGLILYKFKK